MEKFIDKCNHKWFGFKCCLCGETRWLIPVERYNFKSMDHDGLKEVAIEMLEKL